MRKISGYQRRQSDCSRRYDNTGGRGSARMSDKWRLLRNRLMLEARVDARV
jgi:hypothetical protein